ncbi:MAG: hypothetical protein WCV00_13785 [Verrucomicrobiia bacterium]|jgi:hypothetical protein
MTLRRQLSVSVLDGHRHAQNANLAKEQENAAVVTRMSALLHAGWKTALP